MRQLVTEFAASVVEYVPCAQFRQIVEPGNSENFPASQFLHVEMDVAPDSAENVPEPHTRQLVFEMAASWSEYVPTRPKKIYTC